MLFLLPFHFFLFERFLILLVTRSKGPSTGLFIILIYLDLPSSLWACDIFSTHYFFGQGLSDLGKPSLFYGYFLCIDIKSLYLNKGFCNFWSDVCKNFSYFNILHAI